RGARQSPRRDTVSWLATAMKLSADERARLFMAASTHRRRPVAARRVGSDAASSLPGRLTSFIGRAAEIREIQELLRTKRLLSLTGAGGVGKTSLALAVASGAQALFPDGVTLVELAGVADSELVPRAIAAALGVREQS